MGDIYSCAKTVLIGLGPYKDDMDRELMRAFDHLRRWYQYPARSVHKAEGHENSASGSILRKVYGGLNLYEAETPVPTGEFLLALRDICNRPYCKQM
jgi:hypothetical protein